MKKMELKEIREQITEFDNQIILLLSQRLSLVPSLISYKKKFNLSIFQPEREKQLHSRYWKKAIENHINPELVRQIFELIIEETRKLQLEMGKR